jgi:hypothetical protein
LSGDFGEEGMLVGCRWTLCERAFSQPAATWRRPCLLRVLVPSVKYRPAPYLQGRTYVCEPGFVLTRTLCVWGKPEILVVARLPGTSVCVCVCEECGAYSEGPNMLAAAGSCKPLQR